jgi:hypothetical protein
MLPSSGVASPNTSEKSVDFPAPFGPTSPMRSPRFTCNPTASNNVRPAKLLDIPDSVSMAKPGMLRLPAPRSKPEGGFFCGHHDAI